MFTLLLSLAVGPIGNPNFFNVYCDMATGEQVVFVAALLN